MDLDARSFAAPQTTRQIRLNSLWLLLARLIVQAQLVVFTILVARSLGVAGFGQYAFVAALIFMGNVATTFGTDTLLIREVARARAVVHPRQDDAGLIAAALWLQLGLSIAWLVIVAIGAEVLHGQSREVVVALKVYSLSLLPLAFYTVYTAVLRAHERMDLYLLLNVLIAFVQLSGAWWALQQSANLLSLVIALDLVQLIAAVAAGLLCRSSLPSFHFDRRLTSRQVWRVVRLAWPFAVLGVLAVIYQRLGVLMLSTLGTEAQAGWFAAASRVIEPVKILHFAVLGALLPTLARLTAPVAGSAEPQTHLAARIFRRSMLFLLLSSLLAAGVIIALAQPIVSLLFGASYAGSVIPLQILAVSLIPYTVSASWAVRLVTQGNERRVLWATAVSLAAAFLLNRWLIAGAGPSGAALAAVGSESLLASTLIVLRR